MCDLERRSAWHNCRLLDDLYNRYIKYGETNVCENIHFVRMRMILGTPSARHGSFARLSHSITLNEFKRHGWIHDACERSFTIANAIVYVKMP